MDFDSFQFFDNNPVHTRCIGYYFPGFVIFAESFFDSKRY